ncbi:unnamed protein product [Adineta ricciae]|uniref:Uncharacterized protein n=1 Tax=Adineta ricciae TaxID=249248 RepID=A0A815TPQ9_ADIRI|nr:unnamed protein product [Adineta ricciae]CAF1656722.1 unnamed protein product [Adineta ricciae]
MDKEIFSTIIRLPLKSVRCHSLKLSPNDWIMPTEFYRICCVYFYDIEQWSFYKQQLNDEFMNIDRLIRSLTKLIDYYPLLTGTIHIDENDKSTSILFNNNEKQGILFKAISMNISMKDFFLLRNSNELINKIDPLTLFHIRHSRFHCGSVALTIQLNHCFADAHSYFQLIRHWVQLYHEIDFEPIVCHQRSLLYPFQNNIQINQPQILTINKEKTFSSINEIPPSIVKIFRFSTDELERMKNAGKIDLPIDIDYVSTFHVLCAHLFRHVTLARCLSPSSLTKLYISTDLRPRRQKPNIPSNYFGNAALYSYLSTTSGDLINNDHLSYWAAQVHRAIDMTMDEEIENIFNWIINQSDKSTIRPTCNPMTRDFLITAWNKMGMYSDSDFELNLHPCRITLPLIETMNGAAILCSTEKNDGSIDVFLGLDIKTMNNLEKDSNFRKYC